MFGDFKLSQKFSGAIPIGPSLVFLSFAIYKSFFLSDRIAGDPFDGFYYFFIADLKNLYLFSFLLILYTVCCSLFPRLILHILTLLILFYFIFDFLLVLNFDHRLSVDLIIDFLPECNFIIDLITWPQIAIIIIAGASLIVRVLVFRATYIFILFLTSVIANIVPIEQYEILDKYTRSPINHLFAPDNSKVLSLKSFNKIFTTRPLLDLPENKPNVILVIMESLSAIDSNKVSRVGRVLDSFDDFSKKGTLFTNFFANYSASDGGVVALFHGIPPVHIGRNMFASYRHKKSVFSEFKSKGYRNLLYKTASLNFQGIGNYLKSMPIDDYAGGENQFFKSAPLGAFNAAPDRYLYQYALKKITPSLQKGENFFLTLITVSTHAPLFNPDTGEYGAKPAWDYAFQMLADFHKKLDQKKYFDNGILIVVGDHRKMETPSQLELTRYRDSYVARIPLLMIGKNISKNIVDQRFFQQSDLFPLLNKAISSSVPLSEEIFWVQRYSGSFNPNPEHVPGEIFTFTDLDQGATRKYVGKVGSEILKNYFDKRY